MAQVVININDREYPIACENGQEVRIMQLAQILQQKALMLKDFSGRISENLMLAMVGILVADDLFELKKNQTQAPAPQNNDEKDRQVVERIRYLDEKIKAIAKLVESL
ncbi:MAG: cell division protein ZapA [Rhodospirillales bacterium]|nr:cell division protein ZapA [Rhodospirillales bacterium]